MIGWKAVSSALLGLVVGFASGAYAWHRISLVNAFAMYGFGEKYQAHFWAGELRRDLFALQILEEKGAEAYAKVAARGLQDKAITISLYLSQADLTEADRLTLISLIEESETYPSVTDVSDDNGKRAAEARRIILERLRS